MTARLQDEAKEAVGDLVGAFKNPVGGGFGDSTPPKKTGAMSSLPVQPLELDVGESSANKPASAGKGGAARRRSTGTNVLTRTDSRLSNVPENGPAGGAQAGQPLRRNRRSSGFLSLLGYAQCTAPEPRCIQFLYEGGNLVVHYSLRRAWFRNQLRECASLCLDIFHPRRAEICRYSLRIVHEGKSYERFSHEGIRYVNIHHRHRDMGILDLRLRWVLTSQCFLEFVFNRFGVRVLLV